MSAQKSGYSGWDTSCSETVHETPSAQTLQHDNSHSGSGPTRSSNAYAHVPANTRDRLRSAMPILRQPLPSRSGAAGGNTRRHHHQRLCSMHDVPMGRICGHDVSVGTEQLHTFEATSNPNRAAHDSAFQPSYNGAAKRSDIPVAAESEVSRAMLDFAQRWSPYGGGRDEDTLIEFGLTSPAFFERVLAMLATQPNALDPRRLKLIKSVALERLGRQPRSKPGDTKLIARHADCFTGSATDPLHLGH